MKTRKKTFSLNTIHGYEQAEKYKAKHENNGARVTVIMSSLGDSVTILAEYNNN